MSKTPHGHPAWLKGLPGLYSGPTGHSSHVHAVSDRGSPRADESARLIAASEGSTLRKASDFERKSWLSQVRQEVREFFLDTKLNYLLFAFPFAIISKFSNWGDGTTFSLSMIALCPLAERLGFITEQLAMYTNDTLGGLLNASFGNATEVIISGFALQHGYVRVVQLSLLGSVVSNLLLVMGTAFLAGGIRHSTQSFNQQGINVNCALLLLGTVAVVLPSLLSETGTGVKGNISELALSRFESLFLLMMYCCYLLFQLYTHRFLYEEDSGPSTKETAPPLTSADAGSGGGHGSGARDLEAGGGRMGTTASEGTLTALGPTTALPRNTSNRYATVEMSTRAAGPSNSRSSSGRPVDTSAPGSSRTTLNGIGSTSAAQEPMRGEQLRDELIANDTGGLGGGGASNKALSKADTDDSDDGKEPDEEEEVPVLSKTGCFIWLTVVTACIALLSEWIISAIEGASRALKMPMPFLVTILLPIVGNAAEHASAVVFAWKNRIEIALGVAVGSSTQVAVLVVPFTVVLAWCMSQPLDLNFNAFEASVYFISVLLAIITVQDGTANWLKGVLLLVTYVLVAAGFWWHKDVGLQEEDVDAR